MTDIERDEAFAAKKQEIINELLGTENSCSVSNIDEKHECIDKNWGSNKFWYDNPRFHGNMDITGLMDYQYQIRVNNGVVYTKIETPLKEEAPVIK